MNSIRRAAYYNSNGAQLLAVGDNKKAFQSFKISLRTLAQAIVELETEAAPAPPPLPGLVNEGREAVNEMVMGRAVPRDPLAPANPNAEADTSSVASSSNASKEAAAEAQDELGRPYVYGKGLVFYPNSAVNYVDLAFYASVVVFNLVLTYHKKKNPQERDLRKLLALYDLCLRLISEGARTRQYDCGNLVIATLNNKSVVHSELGDHVKARRMLYHVWDVMKYPERRPRQLDTSEVEGIFLNIYLILVNAPQVAGAA